MNYSKTSKKTLPFFGKCLIFSILCLNFTKFMSVAPFGFTAGEFGILVALFMAFLPVRVTSFMFLCSSELAVLYLIYDALYGIAKLLGGRSAFLILTKNASIVPVLCALHLLFGVIRAKRVGITKYKMKTTHPLPDGKLRILQLSDTHPSRFFASRDVKRLYDTVREAKPDMIVLTGDIFDEFTRPSEFEEYCKFFAETKPKYGTWYVFGNHDTSWHWHRPAHTREDIVKKFAEAGIAILEDECVTICDGKIRIAGRRDADEARMSPAELLQKPFDGLTVMLCHEPVELTECAEAGADVTFAGHTHGGQVFPLGLFMKYVTKTHEMNDGMREISAGKYAVVSRGVGTWGYPVRTEGKSEIVIADIETK